MGAGSSRAERDLTAMQIIFLSAAQEELASAALYYEKEQAGLGADFTQEVNDYIRMIAEAPERVRLRSGGYRRVNLKRFPYYIAYTPENDCVVVLAIAHSARKPEYWVEERFR